jgi:hypothetical protein
MGQRIYSDPACCILAFCKAGRIPSHGLSRTIFWQEMIGRHSYFGKVRYYVTGVLRCNAAVLVSHAQMHLVGGYPVRFLFVYGTMRGENWKYPCLLSIGSGPCRLVHRKRILLPTPSNNPSRRMGYISSPPVGEPANQIREMLCPGFHSPALHHPETGMMMQ